MKQRSVKVQIMVLTARQKTLRSSNYCRRTVNEIIETNISNATQVATVRVFTLLSFVTLKRLLGQDFAMNVPKNRA